MGVHCTKVVTLYRVIVQFLFCMYMVDVVFRVPTWPDGLKVKDTLCTLRIELLAIIFHMDSILIH